MSRSSDMLGDLSAHIFRKLSSDNTLATVDRQLRSELVARAKDLVNRTIEERVPSAMRRAAFRDAMLYTSKEIGLKPDAKFAQLIEDGAPRRSMREYNWKWKFGKDGSRYVDVPMLRSMGESGGASNTVWGYASQAATGVHPGSGSLTDYLKSVRLTMDIDSAKGEKTRVWLSRPEDGPDRRVAPGTVRRIDEEMHVTDPFADGMMVASAYSTNPQTGATTVQRSGLRTWRRLSPDKGKALWMAPAVPAAGVLSTVNRSPDWRDACRDYQLAQETLVEQWLRRTISEVLQ